MLRLLFVLMALSLAAVVQADVSIYVEDFEEDGGPGFGYPFDHTFEISPYSTGSVTTPNWEFLESQNHGTVLALGAATQDSITFQLPANQTVVYASVDAQSWANPNINDDDKYSIDFLGENGSQRIYLPGGSAWNTFEISSDEIGSVWCIQLRGVESRFDNITIHVIPEPSMTSLILIGFTFFLIFYKRRKQCG